MQADPPFTHALALYLHLRNLARTKSMMHSGWAILSEGFTGRRLRAPGENLSRSHATTGQSQLPWLAGSSRSCNVESGPTIVKGAFRLHLFVVARCLTAPIDNRLVIRPR